MTYSKGNYHTHLVPTPPPQKRTYRRFRRAHIGELWQHDSSIHQWWPAARSEFQRALRALGIAHLAPTRPSSLLDLHLSLRVTRKVHIGPYIEFDGQSYEIAPTDRKVVTVIYHPGQKPWITDHKPNVIWPPILGHVTSPTV